MTPTQRLYLRAVATLTQRRGFPPSTRELCRELGVSSTNGVAELLRRLEKQGLITRDRMVARSTLLTAAGRRAVR